MSARSRQDHDRRQNGKRNRDGDNQRAAPAAQKQQDHQGGQQPAITASRTTPLTEARTKKDWSKRISTFRPGGRVALDFGQHCANAVHDVQRGGVAAFQDGQQAGALAVHVDDVGLHGEAVMHLRHVAHIGHRAVDLLDGQVVQASMASGLLFRLTLYSRLPILAVPEGRIRFCALMAVLTS